MRPSISVSLEPGLERGVPWGRDLYTFVTSAAGHMMRTLQKPRKNRPSKRQVNHRRFLHNMIQRKFADIEAANHRLASALYFKEGEKNISSLSSHKPDAPEQLGNPSQSSCLQDPDKGSVYADGISKSSSDVSIDLCETEVVEKKQTDSGQLCKPPTESQSSSCTAGMNNQSKRRQTKHSSRRKRVEFPSMSSPKGIDCHHGAELFHSEYNNDECQFKPITTLSEEKPPSDSSFIQFAKNMDTSPSFSSELSPLSLDSCDFSIQMFTDLSACAQAQKSITDITEGQLTDILDLFSVGNKDLGGCMDVESYFNSSCACQADAGLEIGADEVIVADQSVGLTEVEDLHCEGAEYRNEYGYSCHGDQGLTINHFQSNQRSSHGQSTYTAEELFNSFKPPQSADIAQNQLSAPISYHYNAAQLQTYQRPQERTCMLVNCENNLNFTPFEGVAQSFSAPLQNPEHRPIPTPPHEDDWLFTDILKDGKSPD